MTLSELSIRRPVFAWMLMVALILFGAISFTRMGVSQLPDVDFPVISISATLEGAAPEVMETTVVDVLESAVMTVEGVRTVTSSSRYGSASVSVEFELSRNIDLALQDVQAKVAQAQRQLPREMDPVTISKTNPEDQPILWMSVRSDTMPAQELMAYVRDQLKDRFSTLPGVGDVFLGGYLEPNMRIWIDDKKLNRYSLTVNDVISAVQTEHSEPPAGVVQNAGKEFNVRTLGEAQTVDDFRNLVITSRGGQPSYIPIRLGQVARVEEGLAEVRRMTRANGLTAVGLGIRKQRGSNAVEVARGVRARMEEVRKILPKGTIMDVNFDTTRFIEQAVGELNFTLVLSALLTALVCWAFLGSWSSTLNVLLAIPTSVIGTFIFLYFAGFTLNTFTLLALSLSIGIVVDDAIMVLENIIRHREMGKGRVEGAIVGAREITFAAMAATVSVVAIFLPVAFMKGVIGKFFFQFGVTLSVAVLLSLLEALTLTPMRCAEFVEITPRTTRFGQAIEHAFEWLRDVYQRALARALDHRWKVIFVCLAFFAGSLFLARVLNKEFLPAEDQGRFIVRLTTPVGSSIDYTNEKFKEAEKYVAQRPDVTMYMAAIGGFGGGEVNAGQMMITLKERGDRKLSQQQIMAETRKALNKDPDIKAVVQDLSMRGFSSGRGFPVEFTVQGPDWDKLAGYSQQIIEELGKSGLVTDVDTNYQVGMPEIQVLPDRDQAAARGVNIAQIGQTINSMIGGLQVGRYPKGGHRYDIRVKLEESQVKPQDKIRSLFVRNNRGELVPLSEVVKLVEKPTLQQISRNNRQRAITIYSNVAAGKSQQTALQAAQQISERILPAGYSVVMSGGSQTFQESFGSLIFALLCGIAVAYMVLASQFNSFIDPVTVLLALPFSISGAFVGLALTHQSLNIYSMIGLILLMGIVKKNSILLVDFTNQSREKGLPPHEALVEACPLRLRPILMTSIATVVGAIPPALAIGPGAESRSPMAVAVIAGVLISTFLTLFVVPCAYSLFTRLERKRNHAVS